MLVGDVCTPPAAGPQGMSVTGVPQIGGEGAGRGRQAVTITCPGGLTISVSHDIEGQGGGSVSP